MSRITLALATSHTPMLNAPAEDWLRFVERDRTRPHRHKDGRPATYGQLLEVADPSIQREIQPGRVARRHGEAMAGLGHVADCLRLARVDAVIVVGDDQKELYGEDNMPSILVYHGPTIANVAPATPSGPDWSQRAYARYFEPRGRRDYPVDQALGRHLIGALMEAEFDVASADRLREGQGEGHAIGFVHRRLMEGHVLPVVQVFLNAYYPPNQPTPARCLKLGQAIRQAVEAMPGNRRVAVLASGGLSHFTVDEELDNAVIQALRTKDHGALAALPLAKLNGGSSEIRNWICVAGAAEALDLEWVRYVPGYRTPAGTGTGMGFAVWQ
jgi:Catalytic LigB subunit of aromatic ring-opening dioxygenase